MGPDISELGQQFVLNPRQFIGIPLALIGAFFLSLGAQLQHRGVRKVESHTTDSLGKGLSGGQIWLLLRRPSWVLGSLALGGAIVFQLASLYFAPLIVVQPLGAVALVITAVLNSRITKVRLNRMTVRSISMCVTGVLLFAGVAAFTAMDRKITDDDLRVILLILGVVMIVAIAAFIAMRHRLRAMFYVVMAGVQYGFVATLAKVVIRRLEQQQFEWLTLFCVVGLIAATAFGAYFVQNAYASGPPDLVIAGLTVIDPLVAVAIGVIVLGELQFAPLWAVITFIIAGATAIAGVFMLARNHPQTRL
ncbi:MAG TPA: DMT family transporter [Candidatus Lumbricidophila sp.]|nr:DMT family transporter [Candidatus Lumbricidophila sp.]